MDVRRVVTGHDSSGKSVFVSDDTVGQNGTRRRRRSPGDDPDRLAVFMCGGTTRRSAAPADWVLSSAG